MNLNITEYVKKVRNGDREAYGALVDQYQGMVFAIALNITHNYTDSEDVVQDTFLRAYEKLNTLSDPSKFASWLYRIAQRCAWRFMKKKNRYFGTDPGTTIATHTETPADTYAQKELGSLLWNEVASLPSKSREAILLFYVEDFSLKQAAEFLGINESAFKSRLQYGKELLRDRVTEKIESELRDRQPGTRTRNAILAALPPAGVGTTGLIGSAGSKAIGWVLALSAKQILTTVAVMFIGFLIIYGLYNPPFHPSPSPASPVTVISTDESEPSEQSTGIIKKEEPTTALNNPASQHTASFSIGGYVYDRARNQPIPGVIVRIGLQEKPRKESVSDSTGVFTFRDFAPGHYTIYIPYNNSDALTKFFVPVQGYQVEARLIDKDIDDIIFKMVPASSVAGIVVDDEDRPIDGARIRLHNMGAMLSDTTSSTDGRFVISGIEVMQNLVGSKGFTLLCSADGFTPKAIENLFIDPIRPIDNLIVNLERNNPASISGRIINIKGVPIPDVSVRAATATGVYYDCFYDWTNDLGEFTFPSLPTGSVEVQLDRDYYNAEVKQFNLKPGDVVKDVEIVIDQEIKDGFISGIVVNAADNPIMVDLYAYLPEETAVVTPVSGLNPFGGGFGPAVEAPPKGKPLGMAISRKDGTFKISNLEPGQRVDIREGSWKKLTDVRNIRVPAEDIKVILIYPPPIPESKKAYLSGRALDSGTREPITQFTVYGSYVAMHGGTDKGGVKEVYNPEGRFEIQLHTDFRDLCVKADGYATNYYLIDHANQHYQNLEILLDKGSIIIEGKVLNTDEEPVPGACVSFMWYQDEISVMTGEDGRFKFSGVPPIHNIRLNVYHQDYAPYESGAIILDGKQHIENYVMRLSRGGIIQGTVTGSNKKPVKGVSIILRPDGAGKVYSVLTDSKGTYFVDKLLPMLYKVELNQPGGVSTLINVEEGKTSLVDFSINESSVSGYVYLNNDPLPNVDVTITDNPYSSWESSIYLSCKTDKNGRYQLDSVPAGDYELVVGPKGSYMMTIEPITVPENSEIEKDIMIHTGTISGYVRKSSDNSPVPEASVNLYPVFGDPSVKRFIYYSEHGRTGTDDEGYFSFKDVPCGEYCLYAETLDAGPATADVILKPDESLENIILLLQDSGSLLISTIDAKTGQELELKGVIILMNEQGILFNRANNEAPTPHIIKGLNHGQYSIAAIMRGNEGIGYISPWKRGVSIRVNETTNLIFEMYESVQVRITVVDPDKHPVTGLLGTISDSNGNSYNTRTQENTIHTSLPQGNMHLILSRSGKPVYEGTLHVTKPEYGRIFTTTITIE